MIIKKINLENYRSHKNISIELSKGINLILGVNGSGKSSILEAIAKVIFDINDRSGNQRGKNFIRHGEKSAKIEIEFIANDDREYLIRNTFYTKKVGALVLKDLATEEEYKDKEEVRTKLNELCGIKKDYIDIYDNIIIAKQNEFINIFKEKPAKREEVFNKIFNTELYSEMSSGILKKIEDKYSAEKEKVEIEKNIISSNMKNEEGILNDLKIVEIEKEKIEKEIKNLTENRDELTKKIIAFENKERKLETLQKEISIQGDSIKNSKVNLKREISNAKKAKLSKMLVLENKLNYEKYLTFSKELEILKREFDSLKEIEDRNIEIRARNEKISWQIKQNSEIIEFSSEELKKLEYEKEELEKKIVISEEKYKEIAIEGDNLRELYNDFKEVENLKLSYDKKNEEIKLIDRIKISLSLENINKIKNDLKEINHKIAIINERIRVLKDAQEKLREKICPFLIEECENIKNKNIDNYFIERIFIEEEEKAKLEKSIFELEKQIDEEDNLKKKNMEYEILEKEILDLVNSLNEKNKILSKVNFQNSREIMEKAQELKNEQNALKLEENKANLKNLLTNFKKNQEILDKAKRENLLKEEEFKKNNLELKENIREEMEKKNTRINYIEESKKEIQSSYNIYLENINSSSTIEESLDSIRQFIKNIYKLRTEKNVCEEEKRLLEIELEESSIQELRENFEMINSKIFDLKGNLGIVSERLNNLTLEFNKIQSEKMKIENLLISLKKLENKLYKTKLIRVNIKNMGLRISKYMLESISIAASSNFNKITGRTEKIIWTNDSLTENGKENKYAVYLASDDKEIAFEHLSGGEQVAVAISLRETMTEYFSNSRFIILDEPTNNLDKERKKLLAEYMGEILSNLDQSIIVTHDNTFREMAERIIEL